MELFAQSYWNIVVKRNINWSRGFSYVPFSLAAGIIWELFLALQVSNSSIACTNYGFLFVPLNLVLVFFFLHWWLYYDFMTRIISNLQRVLRIHLQHGNLRDKMWQPERLGHLLCCARYSDMASMVEREVMRLTNGMIVSGILWEWGGMLVWQADISLSAAFFLY